MISFDDYGKVREAIKTLEGISPKLPVAPPQLPVSASEEESNLNIFLNVTDFALPQYLKLEEEISGYDVLPGVTDYCDSPFWGFHPKALRMVVMPDEYYLGIRADHLVLMFGESEAFWDRGAGVASECVICMANHKGALVVKAFSFQEPEVS